LGPLTPGEYVFKLNVDDGTDTTEDEVLVTVLGPPTLSIFDTSVVEGDAGTQPATFRVALSRESTQPVQTFLATLPGSAYAFLDFVPRVLLLEFAPGVTEAFISIDVLGDGRCEPDEFFRVVLFLPTNAEFGEKVARGFIVNDDCGAAGGMPSGSR
jgi:hypothetical protein